MADLSTEIGELGTLASTLRQAADALNGPVSNPMDPPDVAESSAAVAAGLEALLTGLASLTGTATQTAADVTNAQASYGRTEQHGVDLFRNIG